MVKSVKGGGRPPERISAEAAEPSPFKAKLTGFQKFISFIIRPLRGYFEQSSIKKQLIQTILNKTGKAEIYAPLLEKYSVDQLKNLNRALRKPEIINFFENLPRYIPFKKEGVEYLKKILTLTADNPSAFLLDNLFSQFVSHLSNVLGEQISDSDKHQLMRFLIENQRKDNFKELISNVYIHISQITSIPYFDTRMQNLESIFKYPEVRENSALKKILIKVAVSDIKIKLANPMQAAFLAKLGLIHEPKEGFFSLIPFEHDKKIKDLVIVEKEKVHTFYTAVRNARSTRLSSTTDISVQFPTMIKDGEIETKPLQIDIKVKWLEDKDKFVATLKVKHNKQTFIREYVLKSENEAEKVLLLFKSDFMNEFLK